MLWNDTLINYVLIRSYFFLYKAKNTGDAQHQRTESFRY